MVRFFTLFIFSLCLSSCSWLDANNWETAAPVQRYDWPVANAGEYLARYEPGGTVEATTADNKQAAFIIIETYNSASGKQCKKYTVDTSLYLACFDGKWYPVRTFEGQ